MTAPADGFDLAIVGGGPGGYVAAIRAAQLGMRSAVIERGTLGGVCLNWGCIPSKVLLHCAELVDFARRGADYGIHYDALTIDYAVAVERSRAAVDRLVRGVEGLLRQHHVEVMPGTATLEAAGRVRVQPGDRLVRARHVVIATGAQPRSLPGLPVDGDRVLTSREALELRTVPASVAVIGGGAVGAEFAWLYRTYGADVTLLEMQPHLLPEEDEDVAQALEQAFRARGIEVRTGTRVDRVDVGAGAVRLDYAGETRQVERVLVAVGITPNSDRIGAAELGVQLDRGFIRVDDVCRTSVDGVYAIGDVTGRMALAHVASAQGVTAVEHMAGLRPPPLDYDAMPRAIYCQPGVAAVGLTEAVARARGYDVAVGRFPFRANGRAVALAEGDGLVKLVVDRATDHILGYHLVGRGVAELSGEASAARLLEMTAEELAYTVHAHPTLSEALKEAALAARGGAIHFADRRGGAAG